MKIIYAKEDFVDSEDFFTNKKIFLVGPTPRSQDVSSWRPTFIDLLSNYKESENIQLFIPENRNGKCEGDYNHQVEWEHKFLNLADIIAVWVPRELKTMPAFTTNVEFGYFIKSGKIIYGRPENAPKTKYLDWLYEKETDKKPLNSMESLVDICVKDVDMLFRSHFTRWKKETKYISSITEIVNNKHYKRIIDMGPKVVPAILRHIDKYPDHFSYALLQLTGENPIVPDDCGRILNQCKTWVQWGKDKDLI
jgi:hypothetical protein